MENFTLSVQKFLEFINNMIETIRTVVSSFQSIGK